MERIKKADVLKGTNKRETVEVESLGGEAVIRPLADAEMSEVRQAVYEGLSDDQVKRLPKLSKAVRNCKAQGREPSDDLAEKLGISVTDLIQIQHNSTEADRVAAAYGLSCDGEEWTPEDVGNMPPGVPDKIGTAVLEISGSEDAVGQAAVKKFRQQARNGDTGTDGDGNASGADASGSDSPATESADSVKA